jgi:hypothetical protein
MGGKKQRHGSALIDAGVSGDSRAKHPVSKHPNTEGRHKRLYGCRKKRLNTGTFF